MHGLGNDFVISTRARAGGDDPARAKAIADRRTGIGCDQLILLEPSDVADVKMRIWNPTAARSKAAAMPRAASSS
jgi:diaminopimelate epimerase